MTSTVSAPAKVRRPIYWSNLFRFRSMWFSGIWGFLALVGVSVIGLAPLAPFAFIITYGLFMWGWLHIQMACRYCMARLRVTGLGHQQVCQKCGRPTDLAEGRTR